jgi:glucose/arabinose dehydrogenase
LLYLGVGDGAIAEVGRRSPSCNASSLTSAFGKVLRIDPTGSNSNNGAYGIPDENPFRLVTGALPELWVFGLRAPHSLSFDPFHRSLCIGESGQRGREEINFSLFGGEHFGWDLAEGSAKMDFATKARLAEIVTPPTIALDLRSGFSARTTGSVVYRGENFPSLAGRLIFASHDGQLLAARAGVGASSSNAVSRVEIGSLSHQNFTALRSGPRGELILLCEDGKVFEMRKGASLGTGGTNQRSLFCLLEESSLPQG